jgi:glycogen synthase
VDIVHANDLDTLPAAWLLARRHRARLVYDSHELYTTQEPDPPRLFAALVAALERALAGRADAVVTTGEPFARELERRLRLRQRPAIVLNCPERIAPEPPEPPTDGPLRVIYQAAMGPGRPLEDIVRGAVHADGVEVTIRVLGADEEALRRATDRAGVADRVRIADPVAPERLVEALHGFHAGLVINRPVTQTDELVVPNKLFEYLMAGLAVVAPRLPGLVPFVEGEGFGETFDPGDPASLGAALARLAARRDQLPELRRRARAAALERYNAETQAGTLAAVWAPPS